MERKAEIARGSWRARPWEMVNWVSPAWSGSLQGRALLQMYVWNSVLRLPAWALHGTQWRAWLTGRVAAASREALPSLTHQVFFPATTAAWQRKTYSGAAGLGREV